MIFSLPRKLNFKPIISMDTSLNLSSLSNGKASRNKNANNNSMEMDEDEVLALPSLEQKFDPMMDSGDSDLPDLEELPAPGTAQLEVCGLIKNAQF